MNHLNTRVFSGSENGIMYEREFTVNWICDFDVAWFPFDSQVCYLEFYQDQDDLVLMPIAVKYTGPKQLSQHNFKNISICKKTILGKPGVIVELHLSRPLFGSILTIFLPSVILVILSQMIQVYVTNHIEMVIGVHLTILLVLATM